MTHGAAGDGLAARFGLTEAEAAVLVALVDGQTPAEIAARKGVSLTTVRTHIARLHIKFGTTRTLDVVRIALNAVHDRAGATLPGPGQGQG